MDNDVLLQDSFNLLSFISVVFVSLSALTGAYCVLFSFAVWSTYRQAGKAYTQLRVVTIVLFVVIFLHYIARAVDFHQHRSLLNSNNVLNPWSTPVNFISSSTSTLAGLISDGLLAWRFYVIFNRARWTLYVPWLAILCNAMLGFAADCLIFGASRGPQYAERFEKLQLQLDAVWGWAMLVINSVLTGLIIWRITHSSRLSRGQPYATVIEAIIESALVTWFGLLVYGISTVAPTGHITTHLDVGFVMVCILPIFFGISQCLITTRLALAGQSSTVRQPIVSGYSSRLRTRNSSLAVREIAVEMHSAVEARTREGSLVDQKSATDICDNV
ncbi:uncharacterized protein PHACADRAFT_172292 [Phanerochaete carnosa HHB-10118-sp]|uniref:Uncharacterized protein n=1 Tax=Phanerochaete carnosa (strain HHB-10118-sp) TaxID=650164 RepID=K5X1H9_PHACS|nr:uncharacterized protein PHACADRAFT_172292 [Phanerochaete carnosa HHB-10118-sp]EKM56632.1 hypothetical protein PHACADRAFT_172292 [Phanerochaete carnosa HHB-10118-sp]